MIIIRPSVERFHTKIDWLDSRHTFSFGEHYDPRYRGFRDLIVINEDHIAPNSGFGRHGHQNMEIITYILEGELKHEDSLGTGSIIKQGEVQHMSAGTGILHSEVNPSDKPVHLLQIWILPAVEGIPPGYEQKTFPIRQERNRLHLVASADGREGSLTIHQDASISAGVIDAQFEVTYAMNPARHAWIQVARGAVTVNGIDVKQGDGAAVSQESVLVVRGVEDAEILLFEMT